MVTDLLPEVKIDSLAGQSCEYSGADSVNHCFDRAWFAAYPYEVSYHYNSRGFRDTEWPEDLADAIWCIGDSFTVGIGSPFEHTWPHILQSELGIQTINVSMDGASNDYIARMSTIISSKIKPRAIVHQWSYIHRRESHDLKRIHYKKSSEQEDVENFVNAIMRTQTDVPTVHSFIPKFEPGDAPGRLVIDADPAKNQVRKLGVMNVIYDNDQLDFARDGHHYDIVTATKYVQHMKKILMEC